MRLLVLNHEYPPLGGGASPVTASLSAELARRGHELDVVTMSFGDLPREETPQGVRLHRVPCCRRRLEISNTAELATYLWPAWRQALSLLRRQPYDLIHAHFVLPAGVIAVPLARNTRLPLVISAHGSDIPGYNPHRFRLEHRLLGPLWRTLACRTDCLVTPSANLAEQVLAHAPCLKAPGRVQAIPYGLEPLPYDPQAKVPGRVIMAGRLLERKGFRTMLRALASRPLDLELHILGDGPDMPVLRQMAAGLQAPVIFHGWLDRGGAEYADLYRTGSIFVFPSQMESFGVVLGEAMTAGMAVITADVGACPEVVGDAGIQIAPDDDAALAGHLAALLADPARVRRMGQAAHERAMGLYTWKAAADRYEALFAQLVEAHRHRNSER